MKQRLLKGMLCMAAVSALGACSDGFGTGFDSDDAKGTISLTTMVDASLANSRSRAEYHQVTADDLTLTLTSDDGSFTQTWERLSDFPLEGEFKVGAYTLVAYYGDESTEGFESPYFYGSASFKVEENRATPVSLTANLKNALLDISYTENFTGYMSAYKAEVHSAGGSYFDYPDDEGRPIYTRAGDVEVFVEFTKPNGTSAKLSAATFTAEPRHFYHVTIDVANESGTAQLVVTFDDDLVETEPIIIDISDEVLNAAAPVVTPLGFTPGEAIELVAGCEPDTAFGFDVIAYGGLGSLTLTTKSVSLTSQGWPEEIDLIRADLTALTDLGLETRGVTKPDKMAVITLTNVLSHINYINGADNTTEFTLVAKDNYGKVSEAPVTATVTTSPLTLGLSEGIYYSGDTYVTFTLTYNGNNPAADVTVQYQNSRGTWTTLNPTYEGTETKGVYIATAPIEPTAKNINLRADANGVDRVTLLIETKPQVTADSKGSVNAFSSYAYIPVTIGSQDDNAELFSRMMNEVTVYVSTDGADFTPVSAEFDAANKIMKVDGLEAGKAYSLKIVSPAKTLDTTPVSPLTTEQPSQLPDDMGKLESLDGWGTNNTMTTSERATLYPSVTSVESTLSQNGGSDGKCAMLRTVGWGDGCRYNGLLTRASCEYADAGLLHLGAERTVRPEGYSGLAGVLTTTDLDCGIEFGSRPSSVTFQYKYTAKNSNDAGQALAQVLDASGNVIATASTSLAAQSEFTPVTLDLSSQYNLKSAKAAKIYIRFMSTADSSFFDFNTTNFTYGSISSPHIGSQLYIDEVVLNY